MARLNGHVPCCCVCAVSLARTMWCCAARLLCCAPHECQGTRVHAYLSTGLHALLHTCWDTSHLHIAPIHHIHMSTRRQDSDKLGPVAAAQPFAHLPWRLVRHISYGNIFVISAAFRTSALATGACARVCVRAIVCACLWASSNAAVPEKSNGRPYCMHGFRQARCLTPTSMYGVSPLRSLPTQNADNHD